MLRALGGLGWPIVALVVLFLLVVVFGAITLATSLTAALGVALLVVGASLLFVRGNPMIGLVVGAVGLLVFFVGKELPQLSVGEGLTLLGVEVNP